MYSGAAGRDDHVDLTNDEIGSQSGQSIIAAFRPAILDRHVFSLDVPHFVEAAVKRSYPWREGRRRIAEETNHRQRLLLRAGI